MKARENENRDIQKLCAEKELQETMQQSGCIVIWQNNK